MPFRLVTRSLFATFFLLAACQPITPVAVTPTPITPDPVATVMAAGAPRTLTPLASPDGQWQAAVTAYACAPIGDGDLAYEQLTLINTATGSQTVAATQTIACGGLGAYGLANLFWSAGSRYLYYTTARDGAPDGCGYWTPPVTRLDVTTLTTTDLGGGVLSADGARLAAWQGREVVIWDVDGGAIARAAAALPDLLPGPLAWSPDSNALVYLLVASFCPPTGASALVRVDLPDAAQTVLLESAAPTFVGVAWDDADSLTLTDATGAGWRYDLATGELAAAP